VPGADLGTAVAQPVFGGLPGSTASGRLKSRKYFMAVYCASGIGSSTFWLKIVTVGLRSDSTA
jgi:hypothetical protein